MCRRCNYIQLLNVRGIDPTANRLRVMEAIGNNPSPIGARDILALLIRTAHINRVTVYRILDLLVKNSLVQELSGRGGSLVYGMAESENHPAHPHFQCRNCGALQCLQPLNMQAAIRDIDRSIVGEVKGVEIKVSGICRSCLAKKQGRRTKKKGDGSGEHS
jgi:Fur family transcriptional regulator, ferric uptake regulator